MEALNNVVFLDRDGVINDNSYDYYIYEIEKLHLTPLLAESLRRLTDAGYLLIVITNQGGVSKGIYTTKHVENLHYKISTLLQPSGVKVHDFFFCPHHDIIENCFCRKPGSILIERAIARYNVDVRKSWFIGDSERDIIAAKRCNLKTIQVKPNKGIKNAVDKIINDIPLKAGSGDKFSQ